MPSTGTGTVTVTTTVIGIGTGIGISIGKLKTNVERYEELLTLGANFLCFSLICRQKKMKTNKLRIRQRRVSNIYVDPPRSNDGFVSSNLELDNIGKPSQNVEKN